MTIVKNMFRRNITVYVTLNIVKTFLSHIFCCIEVMILISFFLNIWIFKLEVYEVHKV